MGRRGRAGGRSGVGTVSPAGAVAARKARGGRRRPRLHCLRRGARSHSRAFSAQFGGSAASSTPWARDTRAAAPAAGEGLAGGGLKWKCAPERGGAGRGRPAGTAGRAPSPAAESRERGGGGGRAARRPGLSAGVDRRRRADRSLRGIGGGGWGGRSERPPEPTLRGLACKSKQNMDHLSHLLRVYRKNLS